MRSVTRALPWIGGTLVLLTAGASFGVLAAEPAALSSTRQLEDGAHPGHPLVVTGTVLGRPVPGVPTAVEITVGNPGNQPIVVETVTAQVDRVASSPGTGPACRADWFEVGSFRGELPVARQSSGAVQLPLTLRDLTSTNQDRCQGVTLTLTYTAKARKA